MGKFVILFALVAMVALTQARPQRQFQQSSSNGYGQTRPSGTTRPSFSGRRGTRYQGRTSSLDTAGVQTAGTSQGTTGGFNGRQRTGYVDQTAAPGTGAQTTGTAQRVTGFPGQTDTSVTGVETASTPQSTEGFNGFGR